MFLREKRWSGDQKAHRALSTSKTWGASVVPNIDPSNHARIGAVRYNTNKGDRGTFVMCFNVDLVTRLQALL
jgi:hypothetical protein